jgi:hypothetical protein
VSSSVSHEVDELNGIKVGMNVIDSENRVGIVSLVFEDGRVRYMVGSFNYISKELSPEVQENELYNKEDFYSDDQYNVGKVTVFFKDGRVKFTTLNDGSIARRKLFRQVVTLGNITEGTMVTEPSGYSGKVQLVFENGTVLYEVERHVKDVNGKKTDEQKMFEVYAKIFGVVAEELETDLRSWLASIIVEIEYKYNYIGGSHSLVVEETSYENLKRELSEYLKANPKTISEKKLRKEVEKYLQK